MAYMQSRSRDWLLQIGGYQGSNSPAVYSAHRDVHVDYMVPFLPGTEAERIIFPKENSVMFTDFEPLMS